MYVVIVYVYLVNFDFLFMTIILFEQLTAYFIVTTLKITLRNDFLDLPTVPMFNFASTSTKRQCFHKTITFV